MSNEIYLYYIEHEIRGEIREGQEDTSWPSREDSYIEWHLKECRLSKKNSYYYERITLDFSVQPGDAIYVVYVRYGDGGTFAYTHGYWTIVNVFKTRKEAEALQESIEDKTYKGYKCWEGYFPRFECCEVQPMVVEE